MIDEGPGEFDAHLMNEDEPEMVRCVSCGRMLFARADRCHHCGVHFAGEAWQQQIAGEAGPRAWWRSVAWVLIIVLIVWVLSYALL